MDADKFPRKSLKLFLLAALLILGAAVLIGAHLRWHSTAALVRSTISKGPAGDQRRWSLVFQVKMQQPHREKPLTVELSGDWIATTSGWRAEGYDIAYEIENAHVTGDSTPSLTEVQALQQRIQRRFWVTYRQDGTALQIHFPKDMNPSDRNLIQMIVTEIQLVRPQAPSAHWTSMERDAAGTYFADYQRIPAEVIKRRIKYIAVDGVAGSRKPNSVEVQLEGFEGHFALDSTGTWAAYEGHGHVRIGLPMSQKDWLDVRTATRLTNLRRTRAPELVGSLERARNELDSSPIRTQAPDPKTAELLRDRRLLEGHSTDSLLAAALSKKSTDPLLFSRLKALLRQRPEAVTQALELARKNEGARPVTEALATAGTAPALSAIEHLAGDKAAPTAARADALAALMLISTPGIEVMRIPEAFLDDKNPTVRRAARFACGALARAGRTDHPAESAALDQKLVQQYRSAAQTEDRLELLSAMGNSVGPAILPVLNGALHDPHPKVRAAAVGALRLAQDAQVDGLLAKAMTHDVDPMVRSAAVFAVGFRPAESFLEPLMRVAKEDGVDYVRSGAIGLLRRNQDASSKVGNVLAWVAKHDPKPALRRLAKEAIDAGRHDG